jgi:hypothetical protein
VVLSRLKTEKAHIHTALLDEMKKVLRYFLGPHDTGYYYHLVVCNLEFDLDPGIGWADVCSLDEHSGAGDVLGKGSSAGFIDTEAYRKAFPASCDIPFVGHSLSGVISKLIPRTSARNIPQFVMSGRKYGNNFCLG